MCQLIDPKSGSSKCFFLTCDKSDFYIFKSRYLQDINKSLFCILLTEKKMNNHIIRTVLLKLVPRLINQSRFTPKSFPQGKPTPLPIFI